MEFWYCLVYPQHKMSIIIKFIFISFALINVTITLDIAIKIMENLYVLVYAHFDWRKMTKPCPFGIIKTAITHSINIYPINSLKNRIHSASTNNTRYTNNIFRYTHTSGWDSNMHTEWILCVFIFPFSMLHGKRIKMRTSEQIFGLKWMRRNERMKIKYTTTTKYWIFIEMSRKRNRLMQGKGIKRDETIMFIDSLDGSQFSTHCIVPSSLGVCVLPKAWDIKRKLCL